MVPVPSQFVVGLKVVNFGMFGMEHLERTFRLIHLRLAEWRNLVSRQWQWRQRYYVLVIQPQTI